MSSCFLIEIDRGCPQPLMFGDSIFGEYLGTLVQNADGAWEPTMKSDISQHRCRVISKSPWWNLSCDDDVWLRRAGHHESSTEFVCGRTVALNPKSIQPRRLLVATLTDHKTLQKQGLCHGLRGSPARGFESIRQRMTATPPYMMIAQHDDDSLSDEASKTLCDLQANQRGYFSCNTRGRTSERDPSWESSLGFWTNLRGLAKSFADPGEEVHLHHETARHVAEAGIESAIARFQRTGSARRWDGSFLTAWPTQLTGSLEKVDRKRAKRMKQDLHQTLCQMFQSEAAIDLRVRPGSSVARAFSQTGQDSSGKMYCHWNLKKYSNRDNWGRMRWRTTKQRQHERCYNEKSGRFSDNIAQWCIPSLQSWHELCDTLPARREEIRFVLKELRSTAIASSTTCEVTLPRCLRFNQ